MELITYSWYIETRFNFVNEENMQKIILSLVLLGFGALSGLALYYDGISGIFEPQFKTFGTAQVFVDLVIALCFFLVWMWKDAKRAGRNPWVWFVLTLAAGSFGPILYFLLKKDEAK